LVPELRQLFSVTMLLTVTVTVKKSSRERGRTDGSPTV